MVRFARLVGLWSMDDPVMPLAIIALTCQIEAAFRGAAAWRSRGHDRNGAGDGRIQGNGLHAAHRQRPERKIKPLGQARVRRADGYLLPCVGIEALV